MRIIMNFIELEKYFIMAFGLGLVIIEALLYFKYTKQPRKLLYMAIGLFWFTFMVYSIIKNYSRTFLIAWSDLMEQGYQLAMKLHSLMVYCMSGLIVNLPSFQFLETWQFVRAMTQHPSRSQT